MTTSAFRALAGALAITILASGLTAAAAKAKRATSHAAPPPAAVHPDSTHRSSPRGGRIARTPGPVIAPGSPIVDRTTIAPFPVPGDTARLASEQAKVMNVPRRGLTLTEPLPPGTSADLDERTGGVIWKQGSAPGAPVEPPQRVDVLPERTLSVPPQYPQAARDAGIQGTVWVMARVLADGTVGETQVTRSVAGLDSAAVAAVRQMKFKPAMLQGKPVAAWIGVPVKFTIH